MKENFKKYLVEFIGTFFLVFTVGSVILLEPSNTIPALAIGFALMIMVYAGGPISGGHYNPAVSLAATLRGALDAREFLPYIVAQSLGAIAAAFLTIYLSVPIDEPAVFNITPLVIGELLFTFALCYVVLLTATQPKVEGNSYFGLAIGSTVTVGIFAVSSICLAAFNPAVALGLGIMGIASWELIIITIITNLFGGLIAACTYKLVSYESY